ncbi:uncharacterized protein V1518DRAFT_365200, partial [Limtongia smithiae]|uniref:uncharacterized protein n=1 Tax=Limtongia smithiae TaxID=1125753 RepID=UPI0034CE82FF
DGDSSDDSALYPRDSEGCHGPMSFAEMPSGKGPFIMCAVDTRTPAAASDSFEFKIVGTEGKKPYSVTISSRNAASLKADKNVLPDKEWQSLLVWVFKHEDTFDNPECLDKYKYPLVFLRAQKQQKSMLITIEYRHDDFTINLATITLPPKEEEVINFVRWQADAIRQSIIVGRKLTKTEAELRKAKQHIFDLSKQLQEFIEGSKASEQLLLEKFRLLLNEKKRKIHELGGDEGMDEAFSLVQPTEEESAKTPTKRGKKS